jgi:AcrR family transcriptional regulator
VPTLRERKRARTRQALVEAAVDLFERNGYERTTIADIAVAADIGTRTFFSYFATKEELLFPESDDRIRAAVDAIRNRRPADGPVDVLLRGLGDAGATSDDMTGRIARLRTRLMRETPVLLGRAMQIQLAGGNVIARELAAAYPERLDEVSAAALTGAFTGAVTAALLALFDDPALVDDPAATRAALRRAVETALRFAVDRPE